MTFQDSALRPETIADFCALSARLGRDPLLIQGPGGNTSIKTETRMWVKASGTELADAERAPIFVAVDLARARAEIDGAGDGTCRAALCDPAGTLRPSIETTFHALLPHAVVVHVHSVATICHAITAEGRAALRDKLAGLRWVSVPYVQPGVPLTRAIRTACTGAAPDVFVLENHGLIVAGDSVAIVDALLADVERRLHLPVVEPAPAAGRHWHAPEGWTFQAPATVLAVAPRIRSLATAGSYYPDHVVFLGPAMPCLDGGTVAAELAQTARPAVIVAGQGVLVRNDATSAQRAMVQCLADVLTRLPLPSTPLSLTAADVAALADWDAEAYRQKLARNRG